METEAFPLSNPYLYKQHSSYENLSYPRPVWFFPPAHTMPERTVLEPTFAAGRKMRTSKVVYPLDYNRQLQDL